MSRCGERSPFVPKSSSNQALGFAGIYRYDLGSTLFAYLSPRPLYVLNWWYPSVHIHPPRAILIDIDSPKQLGGGENVFEGGGHSTLPE